MKVAASMVLFCTLSTEQDNSWFRCNRFHIGYKLPTLRKDFAHWRWRERDVPVHLLEGFTISHNLSSNLRIWR